MLAPDPSAAVNLWGILWEILRTALFLIAIPLVVAAALWIALIPLLLLGWLKTGILSRFRSLLTTDRRREESGRLHHFDHTRSVACPEDSAQLEPQGERSTD